MSYRAKWLRFLATHWEEIRDDGAIPSHLYTEYEHLAPGRICSCYTVQLAAETAVQSGVFESRMPGASWLDFMVAYEALPEGSIGRTRVWLMMSGTTEQEIFDNGERWFLMKHRERMRVEASRPGHTKKPPTTEVARGSVWAQMARTLNGSEPQSSPQ